MTREEAIDALSSEKEAYILNIDGKPTICYSAKRIQALEMAIEALPCEDCNYCHCDKEGYVKPIDQRGHVFVDTLIHEGNIFVNFNGLHRKYPIKYCPMCGRKF